jgi:hypothetical protein
MTRNDAERVLGPVSAEESSAASRECKETTVLKQDSKAWTEGFEAGERKLRTPVRCPYSAGTTQAWSWHSGFIEGDAKRQGYGHNRGALPEEPRRGGSSMK